MDKVLVVDKDPDILKKAEEGFGQLHHFKLLTASDTQSAIALLQKERISVLAADIRLPTSGLELLAFMTRKFPSTPCIALLGENDPKPWFTEYKGHVGVLHYIPKPFDFGDLATAIFVGLNLRDEGVTRKGLILRHFLPLPVILRETCLLEIRYNAGKKGSLCYADGELLDARFNGSTGEAALKEMAAWQGFQMTVSSLPADRKQRRITVDLMATINATWKKTAEPDTESPLSPPRPLEPVSRENSRPLPPETPQAVSPNRLETALNRHVGILRTIKGYKGLAVVKGDGSVLAADLPEGAIDFQTIAEAMNRMHADCSKHLSQKAMGPCNGLTLHTPQCLLIMRTTDVYAGGNYRFIAAISEEGNGHFLQIHLKAIIPKILTELAQPLTATA